MINKKPSYVSDYEKVVLERERRIDILKLLSRKERLSILEILITSRNTHREQYWNHFVKTLVFVLVLLSLPYYLYEKEVVHAVFLSYFPIAPMLLSAFSIFAFKSEVARMHYLTMRVSSILESLSDAYSEEENMIEMFSEYWPFRKTNRYYFENYGILLLVITFIFSVAELIWFYKIFKL